ncbi:Putative serine/threonine-protein kinase/receptor [Seminavis robusta]|uniref:Serine/threonine-protein kinase/receptor n=1 Tax=Seminavis robusta TaxID=568900 RepID=A0A9N8EJC1_9STRA|nr:Putative serine/threonine-protein kinase/receptor [Seminavis robusta]|eukprot:Sro1050_g235550.1 Putative serine/threonine-protein kinase/receptor (813) ;mRNA; r:19856-22362
MGSDLSVPLDEATKDDVVARVTSLGEKFEGYADAIDENGVDGDLLVGMNEDDFQETMDDLGITSRLHRRKLLQEFRKACETLDGGSTVSSYTPEDEYGMLLLPDKGPIEGVFPAEIELRHEDFPLPEQLGEGVLRTSHELPTFQQGLAQTDEEMQHLSNDFFGAIDGIDGGHRPPIPADDLERVAQVQAYGLEEIEPDGEAAKTLIGYVEMATKLFAFDFGDITFFDHESQFSFARVGLTEHIQKAILGPIYRPVNQMADHAAFLCKTNRSIGICNYTNLSKRTFVVHDIHADETFKWMKGSWPFRCYVGTPLISPSGLVLGTLCLHNIEPRPDFSRAHEIQFEQVARMVVQAIENWSLRRRIQQLEANREDVVQINANKTAPPEETGAFVKLFIDGYAALQTAASETVLQGALEMYGAIVAKQRIEHNGYKVAEEASDGSFLIVFHDAVDAFSFALDVQQQLYEATWSAELLADPQACDDGNAARGLRVCAGVHMGPLGTTEDTKHSGPTVEMTRAVAAMGHGGQVLTTFDTWNSASFLSETKLDSPQVVDLGSHVVQKGKALSEGVISKRILQLVPAALAVKYITETGEQAVNQSGAPKGRQFPDLKSLKKLSKSFFDAPSGKEVTIAFIGTGELEKRYKESSSIIAEVIGHASSLLPTSEGYQCQNNMFAFPNVTEAVRFGLRFIELMRAQRPLEDNADIARLVTFGCVHGSFVALEPHKTTGRADYFGKVVNRAARVAYTSELGKVSVGVTVADAPEDFKSFQVDDPTVWVLFVAKKQLKGVEEEMVIYECKRKRSLGQMLSARDWAR